LDFWFENIPSGITGSHLNGTQPYDIRVFFIKVLLERLVVDLGVVDRRQGVDVLGLDRRDRVAVGVVLDLQVVVVRSWAAAKKTF
jgi:hypothetical protein